jgi:hypothetical protein
MKRRWMVAATAYTMVAMFVQTAQAAIESRDILKTYFETGDKPTESIDINGDGIDDFGFDYSALGDHSVSGLVAGNNVVVDDIGDVIVLNMRDRINNLESKLQSIGLLGRAAGNSGFVGLQFDIAGSSHFGFLKLSMDGPADSTPYAIHIDYSAWETTPDTGITIPAVPEPATLAPLALGALFLVRRVRGSRKVTRGRLGCR